MESPDEDHRTTIRLETKFCSGFFGLTLLAAAATSASQPAAPCTPPTAAKASVATSDTGDISIVSSPDEVYDDGELVLIKRRRQRRQAISWNIPKRRRKVQPPQRREAPPISDASRRRDTTRPRSSLRDHQGWRHSASGCRFLLVITIMRSCRMISSCQFPHAASSTSQSLQTPSLMARLN